MGLGGDDLICRTEGLLSLCNFDILRLRRPPARSGNRQGASRMAQHRLIDLSSDTSTRPSTGMRRAMAMAEVGDEQKSEDPTTNALQERVAALLAKEAAVFLPSGTMCNQIALLVHCRPGDEVIGADMAHIFTSEAGGG